MQDISAFQTLAEFAERAVHVSTALETNTRTTEVMRIAGR